MKVKIEYADDNIVNSNMQTCDWVKSMIDHCIRVKKAIDPNSDNEFIDKVTIEFND